jgi:predicted DNA-binding transcriptional regulator AlpA
MSGTMNLTDIARYMGVSRPTAYKIVRSVGFPAPLRADGAPRWASAAVEAWLAAEAAVNASVSTDA